MNDQRTILDMFGVDLTYLTQVVTANPSLRGVIIGYLAERKLWDIFAKDHRISNIRKDDDHDRDNKGDLVITFQQLEFRFEVKSLQTNSISMYDETTEKWMKKVLKVSQPKDLGSKRLKNKWQQCELYRNLWVMGGSAARFKGQVQCDASDKREIPLSNGESIKTTNLKVGEFDILAMGLFAFREQWDFGYMLNRDLPRSTHKAYPEEVRKLLLKTLIPVELPLPANVVSDPFTLLELLAEERRQTTLSTGTS